MGPEGSPGVPRELGLPPCSEADQQLRPVGGALWAEQVVWARSCREGDEKAPVVSPRGPAVK